MVLGLRELLLSLPVAITGSKPFGEPHKQRAFYLF